MLIPAQAPAPVTDPNLFLIIGSPIVAAGVITAIVTIIGMVVTGRRERARDEAQRRDQRDRDREQREDQRRRDAEQQAREDHHRFVFEKKAAYSETLSAVEEYWKYVLNHAQAVAVGIMGVDQPEPIDPRQNGTLVHPQIELIAPWRVFEILSKVEINMVFCDQAILFRCIGGPTEEMRDRIQAAETQFVASMHALRSAMRVDLAIDGGGTNEASRSVR